MKKNYIYLLILLIVTVVVTLLLSFLYKKEVVEFSYSYENFNKITNTEFEEYMLEHPDTIIYISDKTNLDNNKFERKLVKKLEKLNLIENIIYIDKAEVNESLEKKLYADYSYKYVESSLPSIIFINDGNVVENVVVSKESLAESIINYEVFE